MHPPALAAFTIALAIAVALPGPGIFAVVSCGLIPAAYAVAAAGTMLIGSGLTVAAR